ncbi:hypothetical protein LTR56_023921 [Elasticomyces elasticus]|nr:hypothetical protein LTR56_023921 [Elasticomyces elasticus]KAK4906467.1 hypothetical protein LTR49_024394 [Elasticomyces elasticus]KAK5745082.1 hypothetical protein LTS12_023236 [Elasticomyces elasticus]
MDCFDAETQSLIYQIHHAWKTKAALEDYALLRDRIRSHQDRLDVQITALSAVVRLVLDRSSARGYTDDLAWRDFLALAATLQSEENQNIHDTASSPTTKGHRRNYNQISRGRNLAVIEALWSPEIVEHYGWNRAGQGQIRIIRACAVQYPDFEADFSPHLNSVLLARHCTAIQHGHGRTLNEAGMQPYKDFDVDTLSTATIDHDLKDRFGILETKAQGEDSLSYVDGDIVRSISTEYFHGEYSFCSAIQSSPTQSAVNESGGDAGLQGGPAIRGALCFADVYPPETVTPSLESSAPSVLVEGCRNADVTMLSSPGCSVTEPDRQGPHLSTLTFDDTLPPSVAL